MFDGRDELSSREAAILVFSVAVGYIKHLATTRVAWDLLCFQTQGSEARCRQPRPPCGSCVGQVCRACAVCAVCERVRRRREWQRDSGATIYSESLALLLACGVAYSQGFHRSSASTTYVLPRRAAGTSGCGLPAVGKLWPPPQSTAALISPG